MKKHFQHLFLKRLLD